MKALQLIAIALGLLLATCQSTIETNRSLILPPPPGKSGPSVILIGLNGAMCKPSLYIGLFQTIQNHSNYTIWVALPKFPGDMPIMPERFIPTTLQEVRDHGANSTDVFIVGHSFGGQTGQAYVAEYSQGYKGLVILGTFMSFNFQDPQINFPVPVLTISGELDGHTKISRLAMSFNQMLRHPQKQGHIRNPVAIVKGAYHSSFVSGYIPPLINNTDLKPEISNQEAWDESAKLIDAFVDAQLNLASLKTNAGAETLFKYIYSSTYPLMKPLLNAFALEGNPYLSNFTLIDTTKWVSNHIFAQLKLPSSLLPTFVDCVELYNASKFYHTAPTAHFGMGTLDYRVYTHKDIGPVENMDLANPPNQSAHWIAVKYKSADFIKRIARLDIDAVQVSCKELNQIIIDEVLSTVPQQTLERYRKYGMNLIAGDDIPYTNKSSWNAAGPVYETRGDNVSFLSPQLLTEINTYNHHPYLSGGDFYCKLISPAKVAEWIYVDGLRKHYAASYSNDTNGTSENSGRFFPPASGGFFPPPASGGFFPPQEGNKTNDFAGDGKSESHPDFPGFFPFSGDNQATNSTNSNGSTNYAGFPGFSGDFQPPKFPEPSNQDMDSSNSRGGPYPPNFKGDKVPANSKNLPGKN